LIGLTLGFIAGYYTKEQCHIDIIKLAGFAGARFIHAEVNHLDVKEKLIFFKGNDSRGEGGRPPIHYDLLSIDIGIVPKPLPLFLGKKHDREAIGLIEGVEGKKEVERTGHEEEMKKKDVNLAVYYHITPVKPIDRFASKWESLLSRFQQSFLSSPSRPSSFSPSSSIFRLVVVGGGAGGTELAFAVNHRLKSLLRENQKDPSLLQVILLNKSSSIMNKHSK
jgi:selenide,water dikinase